MELPVKLSVSTIIKYAACPEAYNLAKVKKVQVPKTFGPEMAHGTIFHSVIEHAYNDGLSLDKALVLLVDKFKNCASPPDVSLLENFKKLLIKVFPKLPKKEHVKANEKPFALDMGKYNDRSVSLTGRYDLLLSEPSADVVADFKTRGSDYGIDLLLCDMQMSFYAYAYYRETGIIPRTRFYSLYKDTADVVITEVTYLPARIEKIEAQLSRFIWGIITNDFYQINGFGCRFCDFKAVCFNPQYFKVLWKSQDSLTM